MLIGCVTNVATVKHFALMQVPYKDKFTLFNSEADFYDSTNSGFYVQNPVDKICLLRLWGTVSTIQLTDQGLDVPEDLIALMVTMIEEYAYCMQA